MHMLLWIMTFSLLGSIGAVAAAALFLVFPQRIRQGFVPALISYATGTLLAAAFLGMIPAGLKLARPMAVTASVLAGMVLFFFLEKFLLWRHAHQTPPTARGRTGALILVGDAFHNFVDGIVITAAFVTSTQLGISAALAVIAHEVPQEVGDFAILLDSGYARRSAFVLNALSAASTLLGALGAYFWLDQSRWVVPYILAMSAASFIYIATADLIPELHRRATSGATARQILLLLAGIGTIALFHLRR